MRRDYKKPSGKEFFVSVSFKGRKYKYFVAHTNRTLAYDYYDVIANNKKLVLKNNQPLLQKHLINDRPTWEIDTGEISNKEFELALIEAINTEIMKKA